MVLLLARTAPGCRETWRESADLANLGPSWRVKPGLNPVYWPGTSAEWLEQEMWMLWSNLVNGLFVCFSTRLLCVCVCVCLWTRLCVRACPGGLRVFFREGESSRVTLKRAGSPATFSPSHCFSLSAGHVSLCMLQYHCFGFLVLCFPSVFSMTRSPAFLRLSPSISCEISAPSHNKTRRHSHALGTVPCFLCLSVNVSSCLWPSVLCCSLVVVLSLHAPDRWICVLWRCVHMGLKGKALQFSPGLAQLAGSLSCPQLPPTHLALVPYRLCSPYLYFPAFVVFLTVQFHGLCMASPSHRAEAISRTLILLISISFTLLTHLQPGLCSWARLGSAGSRAVQDPCPPSARLRMAPVRSCLYNWCAQNASRRVVHWSACSGLAFLQDLTSASRSSGREITAWQTLKIHFYLWLNKAAAIMSVSTETGGGVELDVTEQQLLLAVRAHEWMDGLKFTPTDKYRRVHVIAWLHDLKWLFLKYGWVIMWQWGFRKMFV